MVGTLKGKISLVYLCLVVMTAVVGSVSVINLYKLSGAIDGLMTANYKSIKAVSNMMEAVERQDSAMLVYINYDRQKGIDVFTENNGTFTRWFEIERNNITEAGEKELVNAIESYYSSYVKAFLELQEIRSSRGAGPAMEFYNSTITPDFAELKEGMKALAALNEAAMFGGKTGATENSRDSMYIILALTFLAISGGLIIARLSTNRFLKPIYSLTQTMKLVKAGDLNKQAIIGSRDEIGELAQEFNNMTRRLQQYEQSTLGKLLAEKTKSIAIVNSISEPLIVLDNDYRIVLLNPSFERFFNVSEEALLNKHFLEGIRDGEIFDFISGAFKSGEATGQKIFKIKTEREECYFNAITAAVRENDAPSGMIVIFQNITQLKELEKIRTDFIATISHEFKTPLTSIMMGTDVLMEEGMGELGGEQRQFLKAIREDCDRLARLVEDLLELTRIESGRAVYKFQEYHVDDIIEAAVKPFYHLAEQNGVNLYFQCEEDLPPVIADLKKSYGS